MREDIYIIIYGGFAHTSLAVSSSVWGARGGLFFENAINSFAVLSATAIFIIPVHDYIQAVHEFVYPFGRCLSRGAIHQTDSVYRRERLSRSRSQPVITLYISRSPAFPCLLDESTLSGSVAISEDQSLLPCPHADASPPIQNQTRPRKIRR